MSEYVNNKEMYVEVVEYRNQWLEATATGADIPQMSNKLASAIMQICTRMANSASFNKYTYKEEMIGDAIIKCIRKIHLFDPERGVNTFAYVSQVAHNCFLHRIKTEQHQQSVKARLIRSKMSSEFVAHGVDSDADDGSNSFVEFLKEHDALVDYNELRETAPKTIHPSLVHRNKTPYKKKEVALVEETFDLSEFE